MAKGAESEEEHRHHHHHHQLLSMLMLLQTLKCNWKKIQRVRNVVLLSLLVYGDAHFIYAVLFH